MNHRRDEEIPSSLASSYSTKAFKQPKSLPRSINYIFKEQHLLFILVGSTFFILQPTLSCLSLPSPNPASLDLSPPFTTESTPPPSPSTSPTTPVRSPPASANAGSGSSSSVAPASLGFTSSISYSLENDVIVIDNLFTKRKENVVHH
ncbi:UDP-glucuronic acid decarboxylase 1-like [Rosa chinensis]|uniref:UDP-glucuronic acid decarboxylase 1-like n=1 Tax=Rosa chinensis TaxID=74649 RepID=UPI000D089FC1|nr:UDP-glucuronic acid decarboxylase 1-like [Rosa chinensis]